MQLHENWSNSIWPYICLPTARRATQFCTSCNLWIKYFLGSRKTTNYNDLHLHLTKACTSVLMLSSYEYFLILHFILKWRIQRYLLVLIWAICHLGYGWSSLWDIVKLSLQRSFMVSPEMINTVGTCIQHVYMYLANKIWQTFSTSSSKASCTPSFVLALKTRQRYTYVCIRKKNLYFAVYTWSEFQHS